jgi:hypothetical protein
MKLHISAGLNLPRDTVTSTIVVYGGKGMGKTNLGSVLVEELSKVHLKWSVLDPLGVWYGVRHSRDGKSPGIECVILGGVHGDMPIEPTGGAVVADLVVDEPGNVIIDFSRKPNGEMWSVGEKIRFITDYTKRVFQRQGGLVGGRRREPFMQILDEAARYIPQIIPHGATDLAACLGAWETLIEEGRNVGIGALLLTQRSARMAKSVSEVADAMFSFRIVGPNSIKAVTDWLGEHVPKERVHKHVEILRSLERGRCLVVSPGWLQFEDVINVRARETFDSSATPKPGERAARVSGKAAKPDLDKYLERMKETIQKAEANDPKKLQAKLQELQAELAKAGNRKLPMVKNSLTLDPKAVERAVRPLKALIGDVMKILVKVNAIGFDAPIKAEEVGRILERTAKEIARQAQEGLERRSREFESLKREVNHMLTKAKHVLDQDIAVTVDVQKQEPFSIRTEPSRQRLVPHGTSNGDLPQGEKEILIALARYDQGVERNTLTVLTGYKRSTRDAYLARLKTKGYWEDKGSRIVATQEGVNALGGDYRPQPATGAELQQYWVAELPEGEKKILQYLIAALGRPVGRETLSEATGFQRSTRDAYLSRLAAKQLVETVGRGEVKASETLFS